MIKQQTRYLPSVFTHSLRLPPHLCGAGKDLSTSGAFSLLVDTAALHSELIGTGCREMEGRRLFWLMTRARIRFYRRPVMMEEVTLTTWPAAPRHYLCNRFYTMHGGGELLLEGRQEWAVVDLDTHRPVRAESVYPPALTHIGAEVIPSPYTRLSDTLGEGDEVRRLTVCSSDIDFGGHVNNAVYPRLVADCLSTAEHRALAVREAEVQYLAPCYEGEALRILCHRCEEELLFSIRKEDGRCAFLCRLLPGRDAV